MRNSYPAMKTSRSRTLLWGICLALSTAAASAQPLQLQVTTTAGGQAGSLQQAMQKVEALSGGDWPKDGVVVNLAAGLYRLEFPLRLDAKSSGRNGAPLIIRGPSQGEAVLSGSRVVEGFTPVSDANALGRLSAKARGNVLQASLKDIGDLGTFTSQGQGKPVGPAPLEVLYRHRPMTLAQWPDAGYGKLESVGTGSDAETIKISGGVHPGWTREPDLWVTGYWGWDWADEWISAVSDADRDRIKLATPPKYPAKAGQRLKIANAFSELDSPGEWYVDRRTSTLYFWPPAPLQPADVEVTVLRSIVVTEGASHVRLDRITFDGSRGDAIVVNGGRDVRIEQARIRNAGNRAAVLTGYAHAIVDSDILNTGQGGIVLNGGDRKTLQPGGLLAEGNRIQHFGRWVKTYRPGILLMGVGNVARGNLIAHGPHAGLLFYGNDHLIEFNELHTLATETGDVGAIYTGTDWSARGNTVRYNFIHDVKGPGLYGSRGIYLDDQTSGDTVQGNLFLRVDRAVFMGGGRDNQIDNNLFVDSSPAIHLDARGRTWQKAETEDPNGMFRKRLNDVPFQSKAYADRYPQLARLLQDSPGSPKGNIAKRNGAIASKQFEFLDGTEAELSVDRFFTDTDFVFAKRSGARQRPEDFELDPASPALRAGFSPLPLRRMSCTGARWATAVTDKATIPDLATCN